MKLKNLEPSQNKPSSKANQAFDRPLRFFQSLFSSFSNQAAAAKSLGNNPKVVSEQADQSLKSTNLTASNFFRNMNSLKLKVKIRIALVVLFAAITLLGVLGGYYVQRTSNDAILTIRGSQNSINHVMEMYRTMNDMVYAVTLEGSANSLRRQELIQADAKFQRYFNLLEDKMIAEKELQLMSKLKVGYEDFKNGLFRSVISNEVQISTYMKILNLNDILQDVQNLNKKIIDTQVEEAGDIANRVTMYMVLLGFFFFVFALFAMFYFPHYITEPIESMTQSIQQISQKNYSQRLVINHSDELGDMARSFNRMAEKLEEYESINVSQILTEKRRTETVVSHMNEAIIGLDNNKLILFANPPALALLGLREHEMIGSYANELATRHALFNKLMQEILKGEVSHSKTFPAISIDQKGKRQYFDKDVLVVDGYDEDSVSENVGFVVILKNITELKEQDLAKTNFMATLSHELKTPISAIDMSLNLLGDERIGELNEEQKDLSQTIRQNSARLLKMVNEILDISRIESGKLQLTFEEIQPDEVVVKALDNVKTFIAEKHIQVIQNISPALPKVRTDVPKTTAVLVNFLTNAIRYTPENETIEINVQRQNGSVEFYVKDHGPGISPADQRKLFQPYRRAKGDKTKGTGLGLAISKEFVEAQGGRIWVNSELGVGSNFGFALPVTKK
jgi:PAS domain S-box-containing protein